MFPNDEVIWGRFGVSLLWEEWANMDSAQAEMDRMDIYHKFFLVARRDALHWTPFIPNYDNGPRILDLGTGTGIWAIDMAE
jgi:ubiquinone/menaquinone biosynthesis C-methylase UbiE